jgi:hypothetical protein
MSAVDVGRSEYEGMLGQMIELGPSTLTLLGQRNYLHSTDIYRMFCERVGVCLPESIRPAAILEYKFFKETIHNGHSVILPDSEPSPFPLAKPATAIRYLNWAGTCFRFEFYDDGPAATVRRPEPISPIEQVTLTDPFAGVVRCRNISTPTDLFISLVEANKTLHVQTLRQRDEDASRPYRFIYVENLPYICDLPPDAPGIAFHFNHLGERRTGPRLYTLNAARVEGLSTSKSIQICFAY